MLFYLVGIKGSGMSALAKVLYEQGHIVRGVDVEDYYYTEKNLKDIPMDSFSHINLKPSYYYIIGNAYLEHGISRYVKNMKYYYRTYPEFIQSYFKSYNFISVCGSHGKTTTTKFIASIAPNASYIIGDGTGCGDGKKNFILESCEYKNTFLNYHPKICLILNVDYDHPDFFKTEEEYKQAFLAFAKQAMVVVANGDDGNVKKIKLPNFITYGISTENDIVFSVEYQSKEMKIHILSKSFQIPFLGLHYAYDFVGAYLVCKLLGLEDKEIIEKSKNLKLPKRRMEHKEIHNSILVHDYAHHPTEIECVYKSLKLMYPDYEMVCIFQPHTISRSLSLESDFKKSLDLFDTTYVMRTFTSVREEMNIRVEKEIFDYWGYSILSKKDILRLNLKPNTVYVFLGAGDIDGVYKLVSSK